MSLSAIVVLIALILLTTIVTLSFGLSGRDGREDADLEARVTSLESWVAATNLDSRLRLLEGVGTSGGAAGELRVMANGTNCSEARRPSGTLAMAQSAAGTAAYFFGLEFDLSASVYSLCWSLSQPDRLVDVHPSGTLTVAGVLPQNATCTLGTLCAVIFVESVQFVASGVALRSVEDKGEWYIAV